MPARIIDYGVGNKYLCGYGVIGERTVSINLSQIISIELKSAEPGDCVVLEGKENQVEELPVPPSYIDILCSDGKRFLISKHPMYITRGNYGYITIANPELFDLIFNTHYSLQE